MERDSQIIWFTGLPGSGKTTLANQLSELLEARGHSVLIYDGDRERNKNKNRDFSRQGRILHNRTLVDNILKRGHSGFVLVATIAPFHEIRDHSRSHLKNYFEIYLSTPQSVCEARDPKKLYALARQGEVKNFTGIDQEYEVPRSADLTIDTSEDTPDQSVELILQALLKRGIL